MFQLGVVTNASTKIPHMQSPDVQSLAMSNDNECGFTLVDVRRFRRSGISSIAHPGVRGRTKRSLQRPKCTSSVQFPDMLSAAGGYGCGTERPL